MSYYHVGLLPEVFIGLIHDDIPQFCVCVNFLSICSVNARLECCALLIYIWTQTTAVVSLVSLYRGAQTPPTRVPFKSLMYVTSGYYKLGIIGIIIYS